MAMIKMIDGGTVNVKANTVAEFMNAWQSALQGNYLLVIGDRNAPEAVINPAHILMVTA